MVVGMKYTVGSIGRVLVVKVEHGDDLLEEIKSLAVKENIGSAAFFMLGALKKASLVVGPRECTVPPEPVWARFADGREIMGIGSIFRDGTEPVIHLHAAFGRGEKALAGCVREGTEAYLVVEVVILEVLGGGAFRGEDPITGMRLLEMP
jgi:predicted DNA-binding protein with PD1-like motif